LIKFLTRTKNSRFIECDKKLANYSIGSDRKKFKYSKEELELTTVNLIKKTNKLSNLIKKLRKLIKFVKRVNFRLSFIPLGRRAKCISRKDRPRDRPGAQMPLDLT
jgi:hypothetical protein